MWHVLLPSSPTGGGVEEAASLLPARDAELVTVALGECVLALERLQRTSTAQASGESLRHTPPPAPHSPRRNRRLFSKSWPARCART